MASAIWLILSVALASVQSKPTTESTHSLLQRLGFDPISRPVVNHHSKRVALETNKARYHNNEAYNSDTDSHMFVVKLPPHTPYYAHVKPEKFENEVVSKPPMSFRTNGKPARVYHWNIPVIKKLSHGKLKTQNRKMQEDSKIYHVKVLPNEKAAYKKQKESHKKYSKYKKHKSEEKKYQEDKKYHENDVTMNDASSHRKNHILSIKELSEAGLHHIKSLNMIQHQNDVPAPKEHKKKQKLNEKYSNEVVNEKGKEYTPSLYYPAIPKANSFYKYFAGNGKPKSFYVIEKNEKPSRYHRLL